MLSELAGCSSGVPDCHNALPSPNSLFAAVCRPLICDIGDEFLLILRLVCRGCRAAADAERKRLEVLLPVHPSSQLPQPENLHSLLQRLPALGHVVITQGQEGDLTTCSVGRTNPNASLQGSSQPTSTPASATPTQPPSDRRQAPVQSLPHCYWPTVLSSLRPQHLRSLELDGLIVDVLTHGSMESAVCGDCPLEMASDARTGLALYSAVGLLSRLLLGAPLLQELALLRLTVRLHGGGQQEGQQQQQQQQQRGRDRAGCSAQRGTTVGQEDGEGGGCGAMPSGWCCILRALPVGLTSLRLGLSGDGAGPRGGAPSRAATQCAQPHGCGCSRTVALVEELCGDCLGAALRRLTRLTALELSGVRADTALAALQFAAAAPAPPLPPDAAAAQAALSPSCGAATAAAAVSPLASTQLQLQQDRRDQQQQQQPRALSLNLLERLVLDLEGHVRLEALEYVMTAGLPRLRHLAVVEQRMGWEWSMAAASPAAAASVAGRSGGGEGEQEGEKEEEEEVAAGGDQSPFSPLGSVLWMLRRPGELRRLSFTSDRSFTTLQPPAASGCGSTGSGAQQEAASGGDCCCGGAGGGGSLLSSVRLSFDLSAEALEPLVSSLPSSTTSLTLNLGTLHRPADVLAAFAAAAGGRGLGHTAAAGSGACGASTPPAPLSGPPSPPSPPPDSPAWLSVPPHSFLGGLRFLWPALTRLPAVVPALRELRLGGGVAAACCDHVLRCWATASGHPDSLATPMVLDPGFNALAGQQQVRLQPQPQLQPLGGQQHLPEVLERPQQQRQQLLRSPVDDFSATPGERNGGGVGGAGAAAGAGVCSDWARSLERVCLMTHGPTVAGALHLRRFMGGLRRLQVVVNDRLTDVAVAGPGVGPGPGDDSRR